MHTLPDTVVVASGNVGKLREIEARNKNLASYETIKKFAILEKDFEVGDELTPTLKVKRKAATQKYFDILEGLYAEGGPAAGGKTK